MFLFTLCLVCFASCKHGACTQNIAGCVSSANDDEAVYGDVTAHIETWDFDRGQNYGIDRFLKISLTNHSKDTDYYLPYFVSDLKFDNPGYLKGGIHGLAEDVWWNESLYDLFEGNPQEVENERFQYRKISGYYSLTKTAFDEYKELIKIVSDNPTDLRYLISEKPDAYFGSACVFIKAGETVSTLVNISLLYDLNMSTIITFDDLMSRSGEMEYEESLYRIKAPYSSLERPYDLYRLADSLTVEWDGRVAFPRGYPATVAGRYRLYDKKIQSADTVVISR
jgi:hypothetical protein